VGKRPSSWPFRDPVSLEDVPDYALIVEDPIDLKIIEKSWAIVSTLISSSSWRTSCVCAKIQDFTTAINCLLQMRELAGGVCQATYRSTIPRGVVALQKE